MGDLIPKSSLLKNRTHTWKDKEVHAFPKVSVKSLLGFELAYYEVTAMINKLSHTHTIYIYIYIYI